MRIIAKFGISMPPFISEVFDPRTGCYVNAGTQVAQEVYALFSAGKCALSVRKRPGDVAIAQEAAIYRAPETIATPAPPPVRPRPRKTKRARLQPTQESENEKKQAKYFIPPSYGTPSWAIESRSGHSNLEFHIEPWVLDAVERFEAMEWQ